MSRDRQKKRGGRFSSFMAEAISLPSDAFSSGFGIEMRGRGLLFLQGCRRIIKYTPSEMVFSAGDFFVTVLGDRLLCTTFHGGTVTVEGKIDGISFVGEAEE